MFYSDVVVLNAVICYARDGVFMFASDVADKCCGMFCWRSRIHGVVVKCCHLLYRRSCTHFLLRSSG